jgi:hypothetical protein
MDYPQGQGRLTRPHRNVSLECIPRVVRRLRPAGLRGYSRMARALTGSNAVADPMMAGISRSSGAAMAPPGAAPATV